MEEKKLKVTVPGKLFIAGEYAVLEKGYEAIVAAVNRYIKGTIANSRENCLSLPDIGYHSLTWIDKKEGLHFSSNDKKIAFVANAMNITYKFLQEKGVNFKPIKLVIESELDDESGKKLGLGSSAAIVVTVVTALLNFFQNEKVQPSKNLIYKLSAMAHYVTQGNGSCADIAASAYGGWIRYSSFSPEWLLEEMKGGDERVSSIIEKPWPYLLIQNINPPQGMKLCVGWTGEEASTGSLVGKIKELQPSLGTDYQKFLQASQKAVRNIVKGFEENDEGLVLNSMKENQVALAFLGGITGVDVVTEHLQTFIRLSSKYGSGKSSGAGGGDCGIALIPNEADSDSLFSEWRAAGIIPLNLQVSSHGATVEKIL